MDKETHIWKIEWNEGMSVGIPEIDQDHKRFIFLVNDLNQSIVGRWNLSGIQTRLQFIIDDAKLHFAREEKLFEEWQYPGQENHAAVHAQIICALRDIKSKSIPYGFDSEWIEAGLRIKEILIEHILKEDMKYADFYQSRAADRRFSP